MKLNQSFSIQRALLVAAALLFGALGSAVADTVMGAPGGKASWTVYAFGNAQAVADAFRALTNFTASAVFQSLVGMIAMIGVLVVGVSSGFNSAMARKFIGYVVSVFLITFVFFGVKNSGPLVVRVEVYDTVDATWVAPLTIPAVVGIPAAIISSSGFAIMKQIEASFPLPQELKMSNGAPFNVAAALISDASQARITDTNISSSLSMYVQDCFIPTVARGQLDAKTLLTSTDFLNDIRVDNGALMVNSFLPGGTASLMGCTAAHAEIVKAVNAQGGGEAAGYLKNASAWARTPALSVVNSVADTVAQWASNNGSTDGASLVKQSAVLASFSGAFRQSAAQTGNSDFLTGLSITQASQSQQNSWVTGAEVFNRTMGYVFAVLQVFVYAITPLILAASMVPGLGAALLKNFMQILLWLAIWQPMLAIVNFIIISMQQADLGGIMNSGNGTYGFTLASMGIITEKTANMRAAATFVGTMVPALAWAMVKGSIDFSRVIGSAVGENFAQGAANTMTTGNYSLNSGSMDSFTANKHSVGQTGDWNKGFSSSSNGGINNRNELGGNFDPGSGDNRAGVTTRSDTGVGTGSTLGTNGTDARNGGNTVGSAHQGVIQNGGNIVDSAGNGSVSGTGTSLGAQAALSLQGGGQFMRPGMTGAPTGGQTGVGPGGSQQQGPTPASDASQLGAKPSRLSLAANANVGVTAGAQATQNDSDNRTHAAQTTTGGTISDTGTKGKNAGENAQIAKTAGLTDTTNKNDSSSITTLAPVADRAAVHHQALHNPTSRFERYAPQAGNDNEAVFLRRGDPIAKKAEELSSGAVPAKYEEGRAAATGELKRIDDKEQKLHSEAEKESAANIAKAEAARKAAEAERAKAAPAASTTPTERVKDGAVKMYEQVKEGVVNLGDSIVAKGKDFATAAVDGTTAAANAVVNTPPAKHAENLGNAVSNLLGSGTFSNPMAGPGVPNLPQNPQPQGQTTAQPAVTPAQVPATPAPGAQPAQTAQAPTQPAKPAPAPAPAEAQRATTHAQPAAGQGQGRGNVNLQATRDNAQQPNHGQEQGRGNVNSQTTRDNAQPPNPSQEQGRGNVNSQTSRDNAQPPNPSQEQGRGNVNLQATRDNAQQPNPSQEQGRGNVNSQTSRDEGQRQDLQSAQRDAQSGALHTPAGNSPAQGTLGAQDSLTATSGPGEQARNAEGRNGANAGLSPPQGRNGGKGSEGKSDAGQSHSGERRPENMQDQSTGSPRAPD